MIMNALSAAIAILQQPVLGRTECDAMTVEQLTVERLESEAHSATCRAWVADAKFNRRTRGLTSDVHLLRNAERAEAMHVERIRLVHLVCTVRKSERREVQAFGAGGGSVPGANDMLRRERDEAQEACRRLAGEVERLQGELRAAKQAGADGRLRQSFYETARFVLAESTFKRLEMKARELLR